MCSQTIALYILHIIHGGNILTKVSFFSKYKLTLFNKPSKAEHLRKRKGVTNFRGLSAAVVIRYYVLLMRHKNKSTTHNMTLHTRN